MALSKIDTAAIAEDAVESSLLADNAILASLLPTDTAIIQNLRGTLTGPRSWSVSANGWYDFGVTQSITPTKAGNLIIALMETYVPAENANNGNNNQYRTKYSSNRYMTHCSDSWNYSDPYTHNHFSPSRFAVGTWEVLASEVGSSQTVNPQWSPDGGGTYSTASYLNSGKVSASLIVLEIRG